MTPPLALVRLFNLKIQRFDENSLTSQSAEGKITNVLTLR